MALPVYVPSKAEAAARRARLSEGDAAAVHLRVEFQEVPSLLPGENVRHRRDRIRTDARADLALQIVHVVTRRPGHSAEIVGGPYSSGSRDTSGSPIFPTTSKFAIVGRAEHFRFVEPVPPAAQLVDHRRADDPRPGNRDVLRTPQVVALVVAPDRCSRFVGVVEQVAAGELVFAGQRPIDPAQEVLLLWK